MSFKDPFPLVNIDLGMGIDRYWDQQAEKNIAIHLHRPHYSGASSLGGCSNLRAWEISGIPLPKPTGIKADVGAARAGILWHDIEERDALVAFKEHAKTFLRIQYPQLVFGTEIYIKHEIIPGEFVETYIDFCVVTSPGFVKEIVHYRNEEREAWVKHPDAQWVRIWDFKNIGGRYFNETREKGLSTKYQAQGLFECEATQLPFIDFVIFNKDNTHHFTIRYEHSPEKWTSLQAKFARELKLGEALKKGKHPLFLKSDFAWYIEPDYYECMYCKRSVTREVQTENGIYLKLDEPCSEVKCRVEYEVSQQFTVGSQWTRGKSFLTITEVKDGQVISINKKGTEYVDSLFVAAKLYKPGWIKKNKKSLIDIVDINIMDV
jgi:hypothetical protein